jgi:hypothetical protein
MMRTALTSRNSVKSRTGSNVDLASDDGLDTLLYAGVVKRDYAVHNAVVGERDRIMSAFLSAQRDILDPARAVKQTIFTM